MEKLVIGGVYRHFKGTLYRVVGTAKHSETLEEMVIYHPVDDDGALWVRPLSMFFEDVERDGKTMKRFAFAE